MARLLRARCGCALSLEKETQHIARECSHTGPFWKAPRCPSRELLPCGNSLLQALLEARREKKKVVIATVVADLTMAITDLTITNTGHTIRRPCNGLGGRAGKSGDRVKSQATYSKVRRPLQKSGALRHVKDPPQNLGDLLTS